MKTQVRHPIAAIVDTFETVKIAVSAAQDYRRVAAMRRAGKRDVSILPL